MAVEVAAVVIHMIVGSVEVNGARCEVVDIERVVARTSLGKCSSVVERGVHLQLVERRGYQWWLGLRWGAC